MAAWAALMTLLCLWSVWRVGVLEKRITQMRQHLSEALKEMDKVVVHLEQAAEEATRWRLAENSSNT